MNRIYRLVWNRSLAIVQVASELTCTQDGGASVSGAARVPRRNALAVAMAGLTLACASAPVWSQTCTPADPSQCGGTPGVGARQTRSPNGGWGDGGGGDATLWITNTSEGTGSAASAGNGGNGSQGIFNPDSSINVTASGGTGGSVGATGSTGVATSVSGANGGAGEAAAAVNAQNLVGGGGGGGGAGIFINDRISSPTVGSTITIQGGTGGVGGDATANSSNGNATNGDPGGGGGGGAGIIIDAGADTVTLVNGGKLLGGGGGAGGNGGYAGGGGGGGDGLLVLGAGAQLTNSTGGVISGGAGGNPGAYQDGTNEPGGYGGGGAGVNIAGTGAQLTNNGSITGGSASANSANAADYPQQNGTAGAGVRILGTGAVLTNNSSITGGSITGSNAGNTGTPGAGVVATGGATVTNSGSIQGGTAGTVQADSVLFSGGGNTLTIEAGASFTGNIVSTSGTINGGDTLVLSGNTNGTFNPGLISGFATNEKTGTSTWTLNGTDTTGITWTIEQGQLTGDPSAFGGDLTIASGASVDFNPVTLGTYSHVISGAGEVIKDGFGTLVLSGTNTYTGGTVIDAGLLGVSADANLGGSSGAVTINGGTLQIAAAFTTARNFIINPASIGSELETDYDLTISGNITGSGLLTKTGLGTLTLSGINSYSGGTDIEQGTLQGTTSSLQGNITDNDTLVFNQTTNGTYSGVISGTGTLTTSGTGTVTLTGANTYGGSTTINAGTMILDGANTNTGLTTVASGATLIVGDSSHTSAAVGGSVSVVGGTLGGYGVVLGSVTLSNSASLSPSEAGAIGSLTIDGDLTIGDGSQLNFDFGAPGPNFSTPGQSDHVVVGGSLSIGSSTLNVNNLGSMGPGLYELFSWTNVLDITGGGFAPPSGMSLQILTVDKEINLIDTVGVTLDEWDANGLASPSQMGGGSGTWSTTSNTWSNTNGQYVGPMSPQPGFAIFGGTSGTVAVDDTNGQVSATGMQFVSDGYHLTGGAIDLVEQNGTAPVLRVSSGDTAIIDNVLQGTDGFNKTDGGTLVLTGTNTYTGTTTLSGGYLSVSSDANLGAAADSLDFEGGTLEITGTTFTQTARTIIWGSPGGGFDIDDAANTFTVSQTLTGTGGLLKSGAGTLVLSGANTYSDGTVIDAGTLQGDTTSLQGNITNNATLLFTQTSDGTFSGAISGSGTLIKNGSGTLTLSGTDTYTGGTTINAGILQGDSNSLQGSVVNDAALVFDQTGNGTYNGVISGSGSVTKIGTGTLSLVGANTYTGGTTVSAGTLQGDSSSLQGNITDNAALVFDQASDGTFGSVISGSGSLVKTGAGTLTLTGANTYSSGTTVSAGTLQGDTTSLQGNIANNATLVFAQTSDGNFSGAISGTGQLIKNGSGTLTLNGTDSYTGGTTISAGTLQGTASSLQGNITNNAALVFDQAGDGTYGGVISGGGSVTKTGTGMLSLTGANTYSGGTMISAGTLQGDTTSLQGNITDNATLAFNQVSDGTYSNVISGSGSLTKTGEGTLILDGANTYTGGTTVSAGTLEVGDSNTATASIDGAVDVQGGGTLRGHGTIVGNVTSDGIVWPGGSVGTLTIQGNYTQNADGTLQFDVTPTQASMLKVTGSASLAGTLDLIFAPGTYGTDKYTLIQAGSVSGTFATVDGTVPGSIRSQISYSATDVDLVLTQLSVKPLDSSLYGNLMRSADLAGQQDMGSVLDVALLSRDTQCGADHAPTMQNVSASCGNGGAWAQYTGSNISLGGADGSNNTTFGLLGGADYAVGDIVHVGLQAGVGQINGNDKLGGNGRVDNVHGGVYAYADAGPVVLSAVVDAMHSDYHFNRASGIGTATSTPGGNMQSAALQAAWPLQLDSWQLTPKVGALYQRQTLDGFSETLNSTNPDAASFPVDGTRSRYTSLQPYAIMAIEHSFVAGGVTYVPEVSLGYRYDTHNAATPVVQVTAQDGTVFDLPGTTQARGMGTASARITAEAGASWSLYADYQGFFGSRLHDNALSVGFTKRF
ncbi:autotransporter-associated beta strand repeat-containing protein [Dyella caseinilytica]|uniref:Autotransporter-associated beta strand repeat-containing protein n=1 Tax=Dyella caseinilytica TaxID=1849581 RepID=A0ABX7GUC1_9GAMM|nr:autotransporter-associated beta strand repeat-containing protein [Dyella caseinilytica]QRN53909.1 autotransporter-associated beta strand repeat-containing protein [Dyella caseinilytica]GFZ90061.1 hypothetical protein GCM10011408_06440 [Dyella caseinilytica]